MLHSDIMAPDNVPAWALDRQQLWNKVEASESRKDSQLAREVQVSLPRELDLDTNIDLIRTFVKEQFVDLGMIADLSIHDKIASDGHGNPHAHVMLTMREVEGDEFSATKNRDWNKKELLLGWREAWADHVNGYLEEAGLDVRIDHRTLKEQGINRLPSQVSATSLHMLENTLQRFNQSVEPDSVKQDIEQLTLWQRIREQTLNWYDRARDYFGQWREQPPERGVHREQ